MKVIKLKEEQIPAFREYFFTNAKEQDESFPPHDEYRLKDDEPAYLLIDPTGKLAGAAVLMIHKEYREARTGRFRMFHCIEKVQEHYRQLLTKILPHTEGLDDIYCFVDDVQEDTRKALVSLGFRIKRYSWVLKRLAVRQLSPSEFPDGFELKDLRRGIDEQSWCDIINESFSGIQGHVHMYPSKIDEWRNDPSFLSDGMKMLWHGTTPVGTMALSKENEKGEEVIFIDAVGVLNSYQGKGHGKNLIRAGIEYARSYGARHVMLSVNAENDRAADLYLKEGFEKEALILCYSLPMQK